MLEGGGDMFTSETDDVLPHVATEDLVQRSSLLGLVVQVLRDFPGDEVGLLHGVDQIPELALH